MQLPRTKQKATTDYTKVTMLLYGDPKIGKSTFCSRFENAFFIATEPGLNHLETYNLRATNWDECWEILFELQETDMNFSPIVVDTVDKLWDLCTVEIASRNGVQCIDNIGFAKGYKQAKVEFERYIQALVNLNTGLIFTSHCAYEEYTNRAGEQVHKFFPSLDAKYARPIINPLVDIIGYISIEKDLDPNTGERKESRVFHAHEGELWEAGDRTCKLPPKFPFAQRIYKSFFEPKSVETQETRGTQGVNNVSNESSSND